MKAKCIAYNEQGNICGAPANIIDEQRGGMVCQEHYNRRSCRDLGNGRVCGNYPVRTGDECTFCKIR